MLLIINKKLEISHLPDGSVSSSSSTIQSLVQGNLAPLSIPGSGPGPDFGPSAPLIKGPMNSVSLLDYSVLAVQPSHPGPGVPGKPVGGEVLCSFQWEAVAHSPIRPVTQRPVITRPPGTALQRTHFAAHSTPLGALRSPSISQSALGAFVEFCNERKASEGMHFKCGLGVTVVGNLGLPREGGAVLKMGDGVTAGEER